MSQFLGALPPADSEKGLNLSPNVLCHTCHQNLLEYNKKSPLPSLSFTC